MNLLKLFNLEPEPEMEIDEVEMALDGAIQNPNDLTDLERVAAMERAVRYSLLTRALSALYMVGHKNMNLQCRFRIAGGLPINMDQLYWVKRMFVQHGFIVRVWIQEGVANIKFLLAGAMVTEPKCIQVFMEGSVDTLPSRVVENFNRFLPLWQDTELGSIFEEIAYNEKRVKVLEEALRLAAKRITPYDGTQAQQAEEAQLIAWAEQNVAARERGEADPIS